MTVAQLPLSYTITQAQEVTGIPPSTLRELCAAGKIKARKVGKRWIIPRKALEKFVEGDDAALAQVTTFPGRQP